MVDNAPDLIRTERLILRRVVPHDLPVILAIHTDPKANVFRPDRARSVDETCELVAVWLRDWAEHGIGYWTVELASTGEAIGFGGLRFTVRDREKVLNLYYRFRPGFWGQGYASEMAAAAVSWAARARADYPVEIMTTTENMPSQRVGEKLGFTIVRSVVEDEFTHVYMRWVRPEDLAAS